MVTTYKQRALLVPSQVFTAIVLFSESVGSDKFRAQHITTSFFQPETLTAMCHKLVGHYFLLTPEDLQLWDSDPENFGETCP